MLIWHANMSSMLICEIATAIGFFPFDCKSTNFDKLKVAKSRHQMTQYPTI